MAGVEIRGQQAVLGGAYFVAASLAVALTRYDGGVAFLWFATAILLADLTSRPRRQWLASLVPCAIASTLATGLFGLGWAVALPFAAINLLEAIVAAWLLRRGAGSMRPLSSLRWLAQFVLAAGLVAPLIAASFAAAVLSLKGMPPANTLIHYFTGHALGAITLTPLALLLVQGAVQKSVRAAGPRDVAQYVVLFGLVVAVSIAVFTQERLPLLFLPVLPIILATFRIGRGGAAIAIVVLALVGGAATLAGMGPVQLIDAGAGDRMQFFQFYLAATVLSVLPVAADLQQRKRLNGALRQSEARYRLLADHSTDVVLQLEVDGRIRYVSPSIRQIGGYDPVALIGQEFWVLIAHKHLDQVHAEHRATLAAAGQTHSFDFLGVTADGHQRWFESHARALLDDDMRVDSVLCVVRDISKRKVIEQRLAEDALTDPLTGLANRRAFRSAVERDTADPDS
ncbi:MAG: MASE1 domain-containing protein, partial [Sphingomicrobium sp.]